MSDKPNCNVTQEKIGKLLDEDARFLAIRDWLTGFCSSDVDGIPYLQFHKDGDPGDIAGRHALAELLRSSESIPEIVRKLLADVIDDSVTETTAASSRKLFWRLCTLLDQINYGRLVAI